ncbi:MAG: hypothetical protein U5K43_14010 [Halofilum sp. (in: g-proteobacteria)]|nr:hypothetical protein [Halofilum sp. (in: g-proteobacteria)]
MFGSISGSASANVASTGAITLPAMATSRLSASASPARWRRWPPPAARSCRR